MAKKVLIIDDDEEMCEELTEVFNDLGYESFFVTEGIAGRDLLKKEKFHLVILDLKFDVFILFSVDGFCLNQQYKGAATAGPGKYRFFPKDCDYFPFYPKKPGGYLLRGTLALPLNSSGDCEVCRLKNAEK